MKRLKEYLKNPASPVWSSQSLIDMFESLEGSMREKQQAILPIIDEKLSSENKAMTRYQFHFLRDITLHAYYPKTRVIFSTKDLNWLLDRFDKEPTQQRATLICILLDFQELSESRKHKIKDLLKGSLAEPFCQ